MADGTGPTFPGRTVRVITRSEEVVEVSKATKGDEASSNEEVTADNADFADGFRAT